jgi:hypothetical protein
LFACSYSPVGFPFFEQTAQPAVRLPEAIRVDLLPAFPAGRFGSHQICPDQHCKML